jgi:deoxyhypusine monooxygenase
LLAHGAAFALGQMQDAEAIPDLVAVLKDFSLHPIVFHEVVNSIYMLLLVLAYPC